MCAGFIAKGGAGNVPCLLLPRYKKHLLSIKVSPGNSCWRNLSAHILLNHKKQIQKIETIEGFRHCESMRVIQISCWASFALYHAKKEHRQKFGPIFRCLPVILDSLSFKKLFNAIRN